MISSHPTPPISKKHLTTSEKRYMDDWAKHRKLPKKNWQSQSPSDLSSENSEKKLAKADKPAGSDDDTRVLVKTAVNSDLERVGVNSRELGKDSDEEESDDDKKKDDDTKEKEGKENEKKSKADSKDDDDADEKDKAAKKKQKDKDEKDKADAKKKKDQEDKKVRELATEAEKKENKKREKEEKEEKEEEEEKDEIPDTTGRNLEDAKASEDKKTDDAKKTDEKDSNSTDAKDEKDSETAGKRRLILRPAAVDAPVDGSASSGDYVQKYALGTRNRVLTSVADTSESVGSMIGNLEKKLLKTLEKIPIALGRGTKGKTEFDFPENFSAKIGQKKSGYNLAGLNSDRESSNLDFARIH
jgi:hypothetical protein